jgi:hypothetical protein
VIADQNADTLTDVAIDRQGNAWVGKRWSRQVTKISPDGVRLANFPVGREVWLLTIDRDGNVLASEGAMSDGDGGTVRLSPEGVPMGAYKTDYMFTGAVDAAGYFWCLHHYASQNVFLEKLAL